MKYIQKYTPEKTYMFPSGKLANKQTMLEEYPAVAVFAHIIETDESGQVIYGISNLAAARSRYNIDSALSEEEAIQAIQIIVNTPPVVVEDPTPSAEERIAAALEYQNLMAMEDMEVA